MQKTNPVQPGFQSPHTDSTTYRYKRNPQKATRRGFQAFPFIGSPTQNNASLIPPPSSASSMKHIKPFLDMKRSRKSNRVSWLPDVKLCQVRLFLSEDCPSKVGSQAEDHLKMTSWNFPHPKCLESNDLPPGFEGNYYFKPPKDGLSFIPTIGWKCPPKFGISYKWRVASGEESLEAEAQKIRELRVLEAVYPVFSAIPPSPSVSLDIEDNHYDDSLTPIIPLTPIEEKEVACTPSDLPAPLNMSISSQPPILSQASPWSGATNPLQCSLHLLEPYAIQKVLPNLGEDGFRAVANSLVKSKEEANLIDTDLLAKILRNPEMVKELICNNYQVANSPISALKTSKLVDRSIPLSCTKPQMPLAPVPAIGGIHHLPSEETSTPVTRSKPPSCPKPQMPLAPMPAIGGMDHLPSEEASKPVTTSTHPSCPKSQMPLSPMPANGGMQHLPSEVLPTVTRISARTDSTSGLQIGPSFSVSMQEPIKASNLARPTLNAVLMQPDKAVSSSPMIMKPNPVPNLMPPNSGILAPQSNVLHRTSVPAMKTNPVKDVSWIKNLIKEHGTEKKEMQHRIVPRKGSISNGLQNIQLNENVKVREANAKFQKPCMYFKSPRGCRNGSKCPYGHDSSFLLQNAQEIPGAKRMKLSGEINGRA